MRVLVLASRIPFPLEKGDKLRIYHQLGALSATDEVILCCLSSKPPSEEQLNALAPWVREVHVLRLSLLRSPLTIASSSLSRSHCPPPLPHPPSRPQHSL